MEGIKLENKQKSYFTTPKVIDDSDKDQWEKLLHEKLIGTSVWKNRAVTTRTYWLTSASLRMRCCVLPDTL